MATGFEATAEQVEVMSYVDFVHSKLTHDTRIAVQDMAERMSMPDGVTLLGVNKDRDGNIVAIRNLLSGIGKDQDIIEYDFVVFQPTYVVKHTDSDDIDDLGSLLTRVEEATEDVTSEKAKASAKRRVEEAEEELRAAKRALAEM